MKDDDQIHAIILTLNEEQHIGRCLESLGGGCASITLIDCGSTDRTAEIAQSLGAKIIVNPWGNYSTQMNFGINALAGRQGWLLRIDADEVLDRDSTETLREAVARAGERVDGLLVKRRIHFLGRRIRYGTIEPSWQLRLWRNGKGHCEQRWMDEHILVDGHVSKSQIVLSDINLNSLTWWTAKHNNYASREAIDNLNQRYGFLANYDIRNAGASDQAKFKRFIKERIYLKIPSGGRALLYFLYRYVPRLGFLDGKAGFYFHILQGLWYRTLVDAKVNEIIAYAQKHNITTIEAIRNCTGIDLSAFDETAPQKVAARAISARAVSH